MRSQKVGEGGWKIKEKVGRGRIIAFKMERQLKRVYKGVELSFESILVYQLIQIEPTGVKRWW